MNVVFFADAHWHPTRKSLAQTLHGGKENYLQAADNYGTERFTREQHGKSTSAAVVRHQKKKSNKSQLYTK